MKEKTRRCWMCRRTAKEVWDETPEEGSGYPNPDSMLRETNVGNQTIYCCIGCDAIIWNFTHVDLDEQIDEYTLATFGNIEDLVDRLIVALNEWKKSEYR